MSGYQKRRALLVAALAVCVGLSPSAEAASFDCGKASTKVEHIICDNPDISKLDDELNAAYKAALKDAKQSEAIKQAQKQWMKERNNCADDSCVKTAYQYRIGQLQPAQTAPMQPVETKSTGVTEPGETVCLAPKIDWRNYQWTLITGKGEAVCEEMLAFLKSRPADVSPPTCPEERLPQNGNWTRPEIRDVSEKEKQEILKDIPEQWRNMPIGVSYERRISNSKRLRVIRGDITRDGMPESMLATNSSDLDSMQNRCEQSKRCAQQEGLYTGTVMLVGGDSYDLLPMNEAGTLVNWSHPAMGLVPVLMGGELVYYKGLPYWMSLVIWRQATHDNFRSVARGAKPDDPYSKTFSLQMVTYGSKSHPAKFEDVTSISPKLSVNPDNKRDCHFGYFHRDNLKQNSIKKGE